MFSANSVWMKFSEIGLCNFLFFSHTHCNNLCAYHVPTCSNVISISSAFWLNAIKKPSELPSQQPTQLNLLLTTCWPLAQLNLILSLLNLLLNCLLNCLINRLLNSLLNYLLSTIFFSACSAFWSTTYSAP